MNFATDPATLAKRRVALRYWLQGRGYLRALAAMDFAEGYHAGTRKDGVTPEFSHQVAIASHVRTFDTQLRAPEESIMVAFLHDVREDYGVANEVLEEKFGVAVARSVDAMTKEFRGVRYSPQGVFDAIAADPQASVVKLCDRIHNHSSMVGVFTPQKMASYVDETTEYFFPMLKRARRTFCDQEPVYEALTLVLRSQVDLLRALITSTT